MDHHTATTTPTLDPAWEPLSRIVSRTGLDLSRAIADTIDDADHLATGAEPGAQVAQLIDALGGEDTTAVVREVAVDAIDDTFAALQKTISDLRAFLPHGLADAAGDAVFRREATKLRTLLSRLETLTTNAVDLAPAASGEHTALRMLFDALDTDNRRENYLERTHLHAVLAALLAVLADFGLVEQPRLCRNGSAFPEFPILYWPLPHPHQLYAALTAALGAPHPAHSAADVATNPADPDGRQQTAHIHTRDEHIFDGVALPVDPDDPHAPVWDGHDKPAYLDRMAAFAATVAAIRRTAPATPPPN